MAKIQPERMKLIAIIVEQAQMAWRMSMCNVPFLGQYFEVLRSPRIGDLVIETSSQGFQPIERRLGYLRKIYKRKHGNMWVIECLANGKIEKWDNANFIRVLEKDIGKNI